MPAAVGIRGSQWAGRRRPRPAGGSAVATIKAAKNISVMAASEKAYYTAKLKMDKEEHALRTKILRLQHDYETKKTERTTGIRKVEAF